ncbi:MAG: YjjG family noncanonical pyrimidine nucleotidase [Bacteroidales bacterium]|nr:YjjG family noncanonical pyrimidine nucleotidase [Bacteroidales bacterium]MDD2322233.1 YjjG family noncanonical pyrimidine nucleotidase [Bacteroidales bacterium]MDD3009779.1 YjjG family noncanonical pyrimidine nucleotidase [Bacteroidales bacterium]MDD3960289.1 YjjG family noncanonical pyrimidine nucleotidase [Bacteroidales bacterium]MDY0284762.1 YjjG family noncanonical pyrimidine nucleotidase [Bacteroidales bacterium]
MKQYSHIFFDLDKTLWDFEANSRAVMEDLYVRYALKKRGVPGVTEFFAVYSTINDRLWEQYRKGAIRKQELKVKRFELALRHFSIFDVALATLFGREYLELLPEKTVLMPGTHALLSYLKPKYPLHIITNGFEEVQEKKMRNTLILDYFTAIITSEAAGARKPNAAIFRYAFEKTGAMPANSLMIGDDLEVDVIGAKESGMDQIYFNPRRLVHAVPVTWEVAGLLAVKEIL